MVIDGAIRHALQAQTAIREDDFETSHFALNQAREFVMELLSGLDEKQGGDVVRQLKGLFGFVYRNLNEADLHRDPVKVADALRILEMHRETWTELIERRKSETADGDTRTRLNRTT